MIQQIKSIPLLTLIPEEKLKKLLKKGQFKSKNYLKGPRSMRKMISVGALISY